MLCIALLAVVSAFFVAFPGADIAASRFFYVTGEGFPAANIRALQALRIFADWSMWLIALIAVAAIVFRVARPESRMIQNFGGPLFPIATLVVGPGLIVNAILKEYWGRPRPEATEIFGGDAPYVEVWRITDYCQANCSFVSGEASQAAWFLGLLFVVPPVLRAIVAVPVVLLALILSANRIAFGAHFLSDVIIAWLITLLVIFVARRILLEDRPGAVVAASGQRPGVVA